MIRNPSRHACCLFTIQNSIHRNCHDAIPDQNPFGSFSSTEEDYVLVTNSFADLIDQQDAAGLTISLNDNVTKTMSDLNDQLLIDAPDLHMTDNELRENTDNVSAINVAVQQSLTPEPVTQAVENNTLGAALTVDRNKSLVTLANYYYGELDSVSIGEFENPSKSNGEYNTQVDRYIDYIRIDRSTFTVDKNIQNDRVSMAISITATDAGDQRSLNLISNDVYISAYKGDPASIAIEIPENGILHASGTSKQGVATETTLELKNSQTYQSRTGYMEVSTTAARRKLEKLGFEDILATDGNFEITVAIGGLKVNELDNGELSTARQYTVNAGDQTVTGSGFKGYVNYRNR